ncbi:MAG TPA: hypothetical protein VHP32_01710 [Ignavibacteria bacterium]|nr:hypothetical protein [Ignavibacteria bacterium]
MNIPSKNAITLTKQLDALEQGILKNKDTWPITNTPDEEDIKEVTNELKKKIIDITHKENELRAERRELNKFMKEKAKVLYVRVRDQIYSIQGKHSERLEDFGLKKLK